MEGEGGNREIGGEIFEIGIRSGQKDARISGERRAAKREVERKEGRGDSRKDWKKEKGMIWRENVGRK